MARSAVPRTRNVLLATGAIAAALLVVSPAAAMAVMRFADPNGVTMGSDCTSPDPAAVTNPACSLERAVETVATGLDEVVVASGNYSLTDQLEVNVTVRGAAGQPPPVIASTANNGIVVGGTLSDVRIEHTGSFNAVFNAGTTERVFAHTDGSTACGLSNGSVTRDSVCWSEAGGGAGHGVLLSHGSQTQSADLRNVTAAATGTGGDGITLSTNTGNLSLEAKNTIAIGAVDAAVEAADATGTATITFEYSSYDSEDESGAGTATVTDPGTGTGNQDAAVNPPLLADPIAGDFHQLANSPTVNGGAMVDMLGTGDFEGEARTQGSAPDIGADEFTPPVQNPPFTPVTPATSEDPDCQPLRDRIRRLTKRIKRADDSKQKASLKKKRRKARRQLAALGCSP